MAIVRYAAYPLSNLEQRVSQMFDEFDRAIEDQEGMFRPAVDVCEDTEAFTIHLEVPGVAQENLDISMQDDILLIRGHKKQHAATEGTRFRRIERAYGSFSRRIQLPHNVDSNAISAHLSDGVLEVRLPKTGGGEPRQIAIRQS